MAIKMNIFKKYAAWMIAGAAVGALTAVGQKYLPAELNFLANSGAIWMIPPFLAGYFSKFTRGHSVLLCVSCLLCCVYGYYGFAAMQNHSAFKVGFYTIVWSVCALVGGTILGIGAYWANTKTNWLKYAGQNLLPSVFLAEGMNRILHIREYRHMIPAIVILLSIGILLYFFLNGKNAFRIRNVLSAVLITLLGLAGYEILFWITV